MAAGDTPGAYVDHGRIPGPCEINWSHPLSIGLRVVIADGTGKNLVDNSPIALNNCKYTEESGFVFDKSKQGEKSYIGVHLDNSRRSECTCVALIPPVTEPVDAMRLIASVGRDPNHWADALLLGLHGRNLEAGKFGGYTLLADADADAYIHISQSYSVVSCTYSALGPLRLYVGGAQIAEAPGKFSPLDYLTSSTLGGLSVGGSSRDTVSGSPPLDSLLLYLHYDRVLAPDELMRLGVDPYQLLLKKSGAST